MPRLELYPFRFRDPLTKKWVRARYVTELHEIAARHAEYEIIGPPEIREVRTDARYFSPTQGESRTIDECVRNLGEICAIVRPARRRLIPVWGIAADAPDRRRAHSNRERGPRLA